MVSEDLIAAGGCWTGRMRCVFLSRDVMKQRERDADGLRKDLLSFLVRCPL